MSLDESTRERIDSLIRDNEIMLFMKGNRDQPQCGFSARVIGILSSLVGDFQTADVLQDHALREGIKLYSSWPTIPQLYVKGEFVGGCDIIGELYESGELQQTLGVEVGEVTPPNLTITDKAAAQLRQALDGAAPGQVLHLAVDARFQNNLSLAPEGPGDIAVATNGITLYVDPMTAGRADGLSIDLVDTERGAGFHIENPSAPQVKQIPVGELKKLIDSGERMEFIDVRTPEERARASIDGTVLFTAEEDQRLSRLPKDSILVFHCHHGGRSQQAAEHFASQGFSNVLNVMGGIDAWSQEIDPGVPRY